MTSSGRCGRAGSACGVVEARAVRLHPACIRPDTFAILGRPGQEIDELWSRQPDDRVPRAMSGRSRGGPEPVGRAEPGRRPIRSFMADGLRCRCGAAVCAPSVKGTSRAGVRPNGSNKNFMSPAFLWRLLNEFFDFTSGLGTH